MARLFNGTNDALFNNNGVAGIDVAAFTLAGRFYLDTAPSSGNSAYLVELALASPGVNGDRIFSFNVLNTAGTLTVWVFRRFATQPGNWAPASGGTVTTGNWNSFVVTQDGTTGLPLVWLNGVQVTMAETQTPIGAATTGTDSINLGASPSNSIFTNGRLAEIAVWPVALAAGQALALSASAHPLQIGSTPKFYAPLINSPRELMQGIPLSEAGAPGTGVVAHPRVWYPRRQQPGTPLRYGKGAFEGFQPDSFQGTGYLQAEIRTAFQQDAFQRNAFQIKNQKTTYGTLNVTLDAATISAQGKVKAQGTLSKTLDDATISATGKALVKGRLNVTLDDATISATGKVTERKTFFQPDAFQSNAFQIYGSQEQPPEPSPPATAQITGGGFKTVRERQLEQIYREDEELLEIIRRVLFDKAA